MQKSIFTSVVLKRKRLWYLSLIGPRANFPHRCFRKGNPERWENLVGKGNCLLVVGLVSAQVLSFLYWCEQQFMPIFGVEKLSHYIQILDPRFLKICVFASYLPSIRRPNYVFFLLFTENVARSSYDGPRYACCCRNNTRSRCNDEQHYYGSQWSYNAN